jgi:hypothetical protein
MHFSFMTGFWCHFFTTFVAENVYARERSNYT